MIYKITGGLPQKAGLRFVMNMEVELPFLRAMIQSNSKGELMINVTKMNNINITVNDDLIEIIEETPDTVITLTTGKKILVKETRAELIELVKKYKKEINRPD